MPQLEAKPGLGGVRSYFDRMLEEQSQRHREETFSQRRANESSFQGPTQRSTDVMDAVGHWAESNRPETYNTMNEAQRLRGMEEGLKEPDGSPAKPETIARRTKIEQAANQIGNHYMIDPERNDFGKLDKLLLPETTKIDLSSPDARMKMLDNLTQNQAGSKDGETRCASASLVAAAVLSGDKNGTEGLSALMDSMSKNADPDSKKMLDKNLGELRKKMASGKLTIGDMHALQEHLDTQLNMQEQKEKSSKGINDDPGIDSSTLQGFLDKSPKFKEMMAKNKLDVSYIDNKGGPETNPHAVLKMGDRGIYDPYIRDEGQIITDERQLQAYRDAQLRLVSSR